LDAPQYHATGHDARRNHSATVRRTCNPKVAYTLVDVENFYRGTGMQMNTEKPQTVSAQVAFETRSALAQMAQEGDRSLSAEIRRAIHEHIRREAEKS
jgi:hypothetical protein